MLKIFLEKARRHLPLLSLFLGLGVAIPRLTFAGWFDIGSMAFKAIAGIIFFINYLIASFFGVLIGVEAWILQVILNLNFGVINSAPVKFGFPVALSLANLIFVFAIIVIGIMTILRFQSYGVKQALWKLIVIAVAVNFGLVICAGILQVFNELSLYFLSAVDPTSSVGGASNGFSSLNNFGSALAGAFNPQKMLNVQTGGGGLDAGSLEGRISGMSVGALFTPIMSFFFVIAFLFVTAVTIGALVVMLLVRYIYLSYLLIMLPIAWACWIFPATQSQWSKWWEKFMKWAFFPPIVLFFLWLVIQTATEMKNGQSGLSFTPYKSGNGAWAFIVDIFSNGLSQVIESGLQMVVLIALLLGGLMTASSLSITGAKAAQDFAMKPVNALKGFAGKKAKQTGGRILDRARTSGQVTENGQTTTGLQRLGARMQNIKGLRGIGTTLSKQGSLAGANESRKNEAEDLRKDFEHLSREGIINRIQKTNPEKDPLAAAALAHEAARRGISRDPGIESYMNGLTNAAARIGNAQEVYNYRPDLAMDPSRLAEKVDPATGKAIVDPVTGKPVRQTPQEAFANAIRKIKADSIHQIDSSVFNDPDLARQAVLAMSTNQLGSLGANGSEAQKDAVANTAQQLVSQLQNDRATAGPSRFSDADAKRIDRIAKTFKTSPNWQNLDESTQATSREEYLKNIEGPKEEDKPKRRIGF